MLNTPSNLSFKFGAKFAEMDKKFTLARNAIDELSNRVNSVLNSDTDEELAALNSKITVNTEDISDLNSTKADVSYVDDRITEISAKVTTNTNNITSLDTNLNALTTKVTTNTNNITSLDTNLNALTAKVTTNETTIEQHSEWIGNLVSSVAHDKADPFNEFYKHLFDMIYPIGSIYTTVTDADPPNIYDMSGALYATWVPLSEGVFLRNSKESCTLGSTGGTATTQLPAHTHTTNVSIDGKLYNVSAYDNYTGIRNCTLLAVKEDGKENVFSNASAITSSNTKINGAIDSETSASDTRTTSSVTFTNTYFPVTLSVNKDYDTRSTTATNAEVNVIAEDTLPDNCPPFIYVKMYQRTQ